MASTNRSVSRGLSLPAGLSERQQNVASSHNSDGSNGSTSGPTTTPASGLQGLVINFPSATYPNPSGTASSSQVPPSPSFDDSYWANQPAAVQELRNIQDPTQRAEAASQLAQQGYSIDVPIMVWGWDPQITTAARQSLGYTWVPSALQQPVEVQPGLSYAGGVSYNPSQPPAGSIAV